MLSCVFWNSTQNVQHQVCCVYIDEEKLISGSLTGEICIWQENLPSVLSGTASAKACKFLGSVLSPNRVFLTSKKILVSIHEDLKIRTWDLEDLRCLNSEKLVDFGELTDLQCSTGRIIAVVYEDLLVVYDAWSLQKLQILKSAAKIIKVQFFADSKIVMMNQKNEFMFWQYFGTVVDPEPYFVLKMGNAFEGFQVDFTHGLVGFLDRDYVELVKLEDLKLKTHKTLKFSQMNIKSFQFFKDIMLVATEDKVFNISLPEILKKLNENHTENNLESQETLVYLPGALLIGNKLVSFLGNTIKFIDVTKNSQRPIELFFEIPSNHFPFLSESESLTYSQIVPDTWQLLIGTSKGKVLISSLTNTTTTLIHTFSCPVTCIRVVKQYILSSSTSGELCIYHPSKSLTLCTLLSPGLDFIPITLIQDSAETSQFWKNTWKNFEESILIHCSDSSISLFSFITNCVTCTFLSTIQTITEVAILSKLDYLLVKSFETVFVFNIFTQGLERILTGFAANDVMRRQINTLTQLDSGSSEDVPCDEHRVIEINWRNLSVGKSFKQAPAVKIQETSNPVIFLQDTVDSSQFNKVITMLTCWEASCNEHQTILSTYPETVQVLYQFFFGLVGDGWFAFYLPGAKKYSKFIDSVRAASLVKLTKVACTNFKLSLGVLSFKSIAGNKACQGIIRDFITTLSRGKKEKVIGACKRVLELRIVSSKVVQKSLEILGTMKRVQIEAEWGRVKGSLAENQAALILPYFFQEVSGDVMLQASTSLFAMLRAGPAKINSACKVLTHTLGGWKGLILTKLKPLLKEMISMISSNSTQENYFKVIGTLALSDIKVYMQLMSEESDKADNNTRKAWLYSLKWMVTHKSSQLAYYSQSIVEIILKTLSPHNLVTRKLCLDQCCEILHVLVKKLPMVDFSQTKQKIAVGTCDCTIVIYDLKTASFWKCLEGHTGPLSAVMFSGTGNSLVSYSAHDLSVRMWKIEVRFYQELFASKNITASSVVKMSRVKGGVSFYKEVVEGVKFLMGHSGLKLVREDLKEYDINITLV